MNSERRDLQIQIQCKYNSNTSMDGLGGPSNTFNLLDISHHCLHLQNHPMPETTKWKRRWSQGSFCSKPIAPLGYNSAAVSLVSFKSDRSRREFWWDFLSPTYFDGQIWDLDWRMHMGWTTTNFALLRWINNHIFRCASISWFEVVSQWVSESVMFFG